MLHAGMRDKDKSPPAVPANILETRIDEYWREVMHCVRCKGKTNKLTDSNAVNSSVDAFTSFARPGKYQAGSPSRMTVNA